jgi:diacylglycerol O-acyltransferase
MSESTLPPADAAWLHMDRAGNPMVVNALVWFDEPLDGERVKETLSSRLVDEFPRFRRRVADPLGRPPRFEDQPGFEIDQHLHRLTLPAPGDTEVLRDLVSDLITPPLDPNRPLWQAYLIDGYGEGCAILYRIHHCIADGVALARVMLALTDSPPEPPAAAAESGGLLAGRAARALLHEGLETLAHPGRVAQLAASAAKDAGTLAKLLVPGSDTETELTTPLQGSRRVAWSKPVPLELVREAAHRGGGTINDALLAAVSGALRAELGGNGAPPDEVHVVVPVNLRPLDEPLPRELGNRFALILLALPVGIEDRGERLREVKMRMDAIKTSHEAPISYGILNALGSAPTLVEDQLIGFFTDKASAVVTNVPGPAAPVSFAGVPVQGVLVWAPCSGSLGMTISIFSYKGELTVGFMIDTGLIPDPQPLVAAFEAELRALCT